MHSYSCCLPACLSVCLRDYLAKCQLFVVSSGNIQFGYMSTAGRVGGTLHSKTPTVSGSKCETITPRLRHRNLFQKNVTYRPSDTHRGWILCQLECRELKKGGTVSKTENKLSPSTDYYRGRCLGVWHCVLRNMCGLAPLYFSLTQYQDGFISTIYLLVLSVNQGYQ